MILIALGANLPGRFCSPEETLRAALAAFGREGIDVLRSSHIWLSAPVPVSDQPWYRNAVIAVQTALEPEALMEKLHKIEQNFGRVRSVKDAPRVLDLDIIAYHDRIISEPGCTIPHPRMHERAFVLLPLREVAPEWRHPVSGDSVQKMIKNLPAGQDIEISESLAA